MISFSVFFSIIFSNPVIHLSPTQVTHIHKSNHNPLNRYTAFPHHLKSNPNSRTFPLMRSHLLKSVTKIQALPHHDESDEWKDIERFKFFDPEVEMMKRLYQFEFMLLHGKTISLFEWALLVNIIIESGPSGFHNQIISSDKVAQVLDYFNEFMSQELVTGKLIIKESIQIIYSKPDIKEYALRIAFLTKVFERHFPVIEYLVSTSDMKNYK